MRTKIALLLLVLLPACTETESPDAGAPDASADAGHDAALVDASMVDAGPDPEFLYTGPLRLSETGLYADLATRTVADDVRPYSVRFELWSDGAAKGRYLSLPAGTRIDASDPDNWVFPIGTRAWKEFRVGEVLVETRYFVKTSATRWERVSFVWLEDGSDALAAPAGQPDALATPHDVPDVETCHMCHRGSADGLLGVSAIQLSTGEPDDLLVWLVEGDRISPLPPDTSLPGSAPEQAALGYLHANCGHCHNEVHALATRRPLRMWMPLGLSAVSDTPLLRTAVGAEAFHDLEDTTIVLMPGDPDASQLYRRMLVRGDIGMPPQGTEVPHAEGAALVRAFIEAL